MAVRADVSSIEVKGTGLIMEEEILNRIKNIETSVEKNKRYFGLNTSDFIKIGAIIFAVLAFYIRTNEAMERLIKSTDWLMTYAKNSDVYHSVSVGTPFDQGAPKNANYDIQRIRSVVNASDTYKN